MFSLKSLRPSSGRKSGFTLLESVVALLIMGIFMTALLTSQGSILNRIFRYHNDLDRLALLNNMFFDPDNHAPIIKQETITREITSPPTNMIMSVIEPTDQSSLYGLKGLRVLQAEASWDEAFGREKLVLPGIMFDKSWRKPKGES